MALIYRRWGSIADQAGNSHYSVTIKQMFADPQVRHRGLVQFASDPELGEVLKDG